MVDNFDLQQLTEALQSGQDLTGKNGFLIPLIKQVIEGALKAEIEQHLENDEQPNRKNGDSKKTIKSSSGSFELETLRDRTGSFEPKFVKKNQTKLTDEIDRKILSMFSLGMSYCDIRAYVEDMYGIDVSEITITGVTDRLIPELKEWQQRSLDSLYPFVWLDAIYYKIKEDERYISKAIYTIQGLNVDGKKELLGLYLSESEGANYWLSVLADLHNRGVEDILIACVDGLTGFPEAIATEVQQCVIHQICNSLKYVAFKHQKEFMADLKLVYRAVSKEAAEMELDRLEPKWGEQSPIVLRSWRSKWENLSIYFKYPEYVQKAIYTTNAIEAVHRQFRKLIKPKGGFPNENSLLKLLYAGILNASKKWTMPIQNWNMTLSQLAIHFEGRLDDVLDI
ncbi:IS256 family transposase [Vibrio harveyi]|uniref:IS256 family transposase n=1 Tax=Vibrio harveyi TaxID=669 RepID=UPI003BB7C8F0